MDAVHRLFLNFKGVHTIGLVWGVSTSHYSLCWLNEIPSLQFLFLSTHLLSRRYPHNIKNLPCSHQRRCSPVCMSQIMLFPVSVMSLCLSNNIRQSLWCKIWSKQWEWCVWVFIYLFVSTLFSGKANCSEKTNDLKGSVFVSSSYITLLWAEYGW